MEEHPAYGHRRVALALGKNKKLIIRVMRQNHLKPKIRRGWRPTKPEDNNRPETRVENILKAICPICQNVVWAGDFTYLWFRDRFWYVATVIDIYTREIVGWHVANHHTTSLIMDAFSNALRLTKTTPKYFHSDQGSEYVAGAYESLFANNQTISLHSRKSSSWQNGHQESFYSQFKLELGNPARFNHIGELIEAVHQQIAYYNQRRIHSALKMPPMIFKNIQLQKNAVHNTAFKYQFIYSSTMRNSV
ncbi:MAG: IS3 family transposase [Candidatus Magasanikbacteria bacterium]|nr:IS3 family transposase [Candidatus Magasanikbacteria bacterium]